MFSYHDQYNKFYKFVISSHLWFLCQSWSRRCWYFHRCYQHAWFYQEHPGPCLNAEDNSPMAPNQNSPQQPGIGGSGRVGLMAEPLIATKILFEGRLVRCVVGVLFDVASGYLSIASFLTMMAISIDKCMAAQLKMRYRVVVTVKCSTRAVVFICVLAIPWPISFFLWASRRTVYLCRLLHQRVFNALSSLSYKFASFFNNSERVCNIQLTQNHQSKVKGKWTSYDTRTRSVACFITRLGESEGQ